MIIHSLTWNKERKNSRFLVISNRRSKLIGRTTENVFVLALAQKVSDFLLDLLDQPVSEFIPGKAPYSRGWSDQNSKTIQEERVEKGQFNPRIGRSCDFFMQNDTWMRKNADLLPENRRYILFDVGKRTLKREYVDGQPWQNETILTVNKPLTTPCELHSQE